jgi:hypothetical protein
MLQTLILSNLLLSSAFSSIITRQTKPLWQPEVGAKFQIILSQSSIDLGGLTLSPEGADVWDIDLVDNSKEVIQALHRLGKKVICYFSAGTTESWRPDYAAFLPADLGAGLPEWPREKWLDIRSANVFEVMKKRIKLASDKGCDGIDPDNMGEFILSSIGTCEANVR